jgi:hypothetical protein
VRAAGQRQKWTLAAALVVLGLMPPASLLEAQTGPLLARAASVTGVAVVYNDNSGNAFALSAGFLLNPGDRVDTRAGGRVVIDLSDGSMVVVEPQSVIVLKDFRQADSLRELFEILSGKVRVKINHFGGRPNPYRMNSPTASIAVRGTEFSIEVGAGGETQVIVYEGAVQVTSLSDPNQSVLVEAGRGVLVEAGQDFHMLAAAGNPLAARPAGDHRGAQAPGDLDQPANFVPAAASNPSGGNPGLGPHNDRDGATPRATASAYDSYVAGLSDIAQMPFLLRFNAFPEAHLDSLENPAFATQFDTAEVRAFVLPTFGGGPDPDENRAAFGPAGTAPGNYSISPEISIFSPLGRSNFFVGGSASGSRVSDNSATSSPDEDPVSPGQSSSMTHAAGGSSSSFYSGSLVLARRLGATSIGLELESLHGAGSLSSTNTDADYQASVEQILAASRISQTRLTAGLSHDFGRGTTLGVFYRYGWISANDRDLSHTINGVPVGLNSTDSAGHSSEVGFRLRGILKPRLFYGVTGAWSGVSLADGLVRTDTVNSHELDRAQRGSLGFGVGYVLSRRTVLTLDAAAGTSRVASSRFEDATGNLLQNGVANGHFLSTHAAVQTDLSRHLFVSASFLNVWHAQHLNVALFPDQFGGTNLVQDSFFPLTPSAYQLASHFSDFGVGWRFSRSLFVQYLFTTDYGVTPSSHAIMLRYTFKLRKGE